jgi:hypothetical protein
MIPKFASFSIIAQPVLEYRMSKSLQKRCNIRENYKVTALISAEWQGVALRWEGAFCLMRLDFTHRQRLYYLASAVDNLATPASA